MGFGLSNHKLDSNTCFFFCFFFVFFVFFFCIVIVLLLQVSNYFKTFIAVFTRTLFRFYNV